VRGRPALEVVPIHRRPSRSRRGIAPLALVLLAFALFSLTPTPTAAETKVYHISRYFVAIGVNPDASLSIHETIVFEFDQGVFTFAYRDIPWHGFDEIRDVAVTEGGGSVPSTFSFKSGGGGMRSAGRSRRRRRPRTGRSRSTTS